MKKSFITKMTALSAMLALTLTGCTTGGDSSSAADSGATSATTTASAEATSEPAATTAADEEKPASVEITDYYGAVTVPVNPKNVVALDNRTFETLADWGIELAAVPKGVMPGDSVYVTDENVLDIGNHSEPNLEIIAAVEPELVIVGQRFVKYYEEIKELVPNAVVIDLNFDVTESGESLVNGLKNSTTILGKIFDKNTEAEKLNADFDAAIADAKAAYNGTDTVMSVVVSGGDIGFSAPKTGRVWGPMYELFGWKAALEVDGSTSDHQGDDISIEAIAQSNPDWIFVLDRDAAISTLTDAVPAQDVIDNSPALQETTAVVNNHIIYAPNDTYTNESIQTYLELFKNIASTLKG